jgi:hypothetical protein
VVVGSAFVVADADADRGVDPSAVTLHCIISLKLDMGRPSKRNLMSLVLVKQQMFFVVNRCHKAKTHGAQAA